MSGGGFLQYMDAFDISLPVYPLPIDEDTLRAIEIMDPNII